MKVVQIVNVFLNYLSNMKHVNYYTALMGVIFASIFTFLIYPAISVSYNAVLDGDHYGALAHGLVKYHTLSYYPDNQATLERGPIYPLFLALIISFTGNQWLYYAQLAQCCLFGLTCFMVFSMTEKLYGKKVAVLAALVCAINPFLIWYTSRIMMETLLISLFTLLSTCILYFTLRQTTSKLIIIGVTLGVLTLSKQTFLPFIVIVPLMLTLIKKVRIGYRDALYLFLIAFMIVLPWSIRNLNLTHKVIPVQLLAGLNFQVGDRFVEDFSKAPFAYGDLWDMNYQKIMSSAPTLPHNALKWQKEVSDDSFYLKQSKSRYLEQPLFLIKKIALNILFFWTYGGSKSKTIVITLLQLPILVLFARNAVKLLSNDGFRTIYAVHISLVMLYYMFHLPMNAIARYSVVLIPTMTMYAMAFLKPYIYRHDGDQS